MALMIILLCLTLPYLWNIIEVIFFSKRVTLLVQLDMYKWVAVGFVLLAVARRFFRKNLLFLETFSHELTHMVVAHVFGRRVHSLHVDEGSGAVYTSGTHQYTLVPVALAPYCLPIFTYLLLSIRWMINPNGVWIYDILIGMTICFHFYCFKSQTGRHQTDINQYPLSFSFLYIITALIINACIILPSFFPNMNGQGHVQPLREYGMWSAIVRLFDAWWNQILAVVS